MRIRLQCQFYLNCRAYHYNTQLREGQKKEKVKAGLPKNKKIVRLKEKILIAQDLRWSILILNKYIDSQIKTIKLLSVKLVNYLMITFRKFKNKSIMIQTTRVKFISRVLNWNKANQLIQVNIKLKSFTKLSSRKIFKKVF